MAPAPRTPPRGPGRAGPPGSGPGGGLGVLSPPRPRTRQPPDERDPGDIWPGWPPVPPSDRDGFGGGGGDDDEERPRGDRSADAALFALRLALAGVTTLFLVFLGVWLLLLRGTPGSGPGAFRPANTIWVSTLALLLSSFALVRAVRIARRRRAGAWRRWLVAALVLGVAFLASQTSIWIDLRAQGHVPSTNGYGAVFYALTGVHAVHVLVGLAFLAWQLLPGRPAGLQGLRLGASYWHFMAGIWIVLFVVLYFVR